MVRDYIGTTLDGDLRDVSDALKRFCCGVIIHTGRQALPLADRVWA